MKKSQSIFTAVLFFMAAAASTQPLEPVSVTRLAIPEPSGLCLASSGDSLWCVSDKTGYLHRIDFDGNIIESFNFGLSDPEAVYDLNGTVFVVEERRNSVTVIEGNKRVRTIKLEKTGKRANKGPEGIAYNSREKLFYIANEKSPVQISVYDDSFNFIKGYRFRFPDISGLCYDDANRKLWVLSHEGSEIYILDNEMKMVDNIKIDILQAEGIALDFDRGFFYICSDRDSLFYRFRIPEKYMSEIPAQPENN